MTTAMIAIVIGICCLLSAVLSAPQQEAAMPALMIAGELQNAAVSGPAMPNMREMEFTTSQGAGAVMANAADMVRQKRRACNNGTRTNVTEDAAELRRRRETMAENRPVLQQPTHGDDDSSHSHSHEMPPPPSPPQQQRSKRAAPPPMDDSNSDSESQSHEH